MDMERVTDMDMEEWEIWDLDLVMEVMDLDMAVVMDQDMVVVMDLDMVVVMEVVTDLDMALE